jgi:hypothetical protein
MFPEFEIVRRQRPVTITVESTSPSRPAANAAIEVACDGPVSLTFTSGADVLTGRYDGRRVWLETTSGSRRTTHASRRHARVRRGAGRFALTLTGTMLTALIQETDGAWAARARVDLSELGIEPRDEAWLADLTADHEGAAGDARTGATSAR